jgi:hypothetical protein
MISKPILHPDVVDLSGTSAPPNVPSSLPQELLPSEFRSILVRLAQKYGAGLNVNVTDREWVEISVANLSGSELHTQLQNARDVLFGDAESRLQVIPSQQASGVTIYLHLLSPPQWGDLSTMSTLRK